MVSRADSVGKERVQICDKYMILIRTTLYASGTVLLGIIAYILTEMAM